MPRDVLLLQFDLDPVAAYVAALRGERSRPGPGDPVYETALPRILDLLAERGLVATFFVVGGWVEGARPVAALRRAVDGGHELANHSWSHPLGFSGLAEAQLVDEVARAHEAVLDASGAACTGFRAPGWDVSGRLLRVLAERGYAYDASVLPSWTAPLQALAFSVAAALRGRRARIGRGAWRAAFGPKRAYRPDPERPWRRARGSASPTVEVPAGVSRWGVPLCATVQLALGARGLARTVERERGVLAYVFHGVDFLDRSELGAHLGGHPVARRSRGRERAERILDTLAKRPSMRTDAHAAAFLAGSAGVD